MNEEVNDNYYVCNHCGNLFMEETLGEENKKCSICGSTDLDFFEG